MNPTPEVVIEKANAQLLKSVQAIFKGKSDVSLERVHLMNIMDGSGYVPKPGTEGRYQDLGSRARINLLLETNVSLWQAHCNWIEGFQEGACMAFPARELISATDSENSVNWFPVWDTARGKLGNLTRATNASEMGRMIAALSDPIWSELSIFGLPYPPFKYMSDMSPEEVDFDEALEMKCIDEDDAQCALRIDSIPPLIGFETDLSGIPFDGDDD